MNDQLLDELQGIHQAQGAPQTIDRLISALRAEKRFHSLFDALMMKRRLELGLPLTRPASLKDVPEPLRDEFERFYVDTAREVGRLLLADGSIPEAWNYFHAINEPQAVADAIDALSDDAPADEKVIEIALFHGAAPAKGTKLFLASHGACGTITALDQQFPQLSPEASAGCARVLVRKLYDDLRDNVEHDALKRDPATPRGQSLRELITSRAELFAEDNYHIDVSHLNAVVRFGRTLSAEFPELDLALQMAQYGSRLAAQFQYGGNPPFDEFYPAHIRYFEVLLGTNREQGIDYFRAKVGEDPAETDNQLAAYVLVDLLQRLGRLEEALEIACQRLGDVSPEFGLQLPELCAQTGRYDLLAGLARERGDAVQYAAALIGAAK